MEIEEPIVITRNKKEISEKQRIALEKARDAKAKKAKTKLEPVIETETENIETKNASVSSMDFSMDFFFPKREMLLVIGGVLLMSSTYLLTFGKTKQVTMKEIQETTYATQSSAPITKSGIILDF